MNIVQRFNRFQLNEYTVFDQEIGHIFPDDDSIILNREPMLLGDQEAGFVQFMSESVFVDFLKKAATQAVAHFVGTSDNLLCDLVVGHYSA